MDSASFQEVQMLKKQLCLRFTDGDRAGKERQLTFEQRKPEGGRHRQAWTEGSLRNTRNTLGAGAETRGLRGRQSKGEGALEDQRHLEDRVHFT